MYEDETNRANARSLGRSPAGTGPPARQTVEGTAMTEYLSVRARLRAVAATKDATRYEQLVERLTPEVENVLFCLQECVVLGLFDVGQLLRSATEREAERRR